MISFSFDRSQTPALARMRARGRNFLCPAHHWPAISALVDTTHPTSSRESWYTRYCVINNFIKRELVYTLHATRYTTLYNQYAVFKRVKFVCDHKHTQEQ